MPKGRAVFTAAQRVWIRRLWREHGTAEVAKILNDWFGTSFTIRQVAVIAGREHRRWLIPEVEDWLRDHIHERSLADTCAELRRVFGIRVRHGQLRAANANHKFGKVSRNLPRPQEWLLSDDEIDWLREMYPLHRPAETLRQFNETWGRSLTRGQLVGAQGRHKLGRSKGWEKARFQPGQGGTHSPEQLAAFLEGGKKTRFQKGQEPPNRVPLYTERWVNAGGRPYLEIKVPGRTHSAARRKLNTEQESHWVGKARWVWEQANGPTPEGHVVIVLDGDQANSTPANLVCVPRAVLARLNHRSSPDYAGPDLNPARVRMAQIKQAIATGARP